ncbi:MAG: hypothetical protein LC746_05865 [Acidobacteria bacterium]|nr:hypothetical protein [Acidobacteriota bacterium]
MPRENLFARRLREAEQERHIQQRLADRKKIIADEIAPPTIDEQLVRLEEDLRKLKVEYDIFFNGAAKRPPFDTKSRVETIIKRIFDERKLTYAQRYRYNTLVARYVALRELWRRNTQDREEGRDPIAAARAALGKGGEPAERERHATFVCADGRSDKETVRGLFDALVEAKRACGEPTDDLSFAKFHRMVASQTDKLKKKLGCERVRYSIYTEGGAVSFKAKADE